MDMFTARHARQIRAGRGCLHAPTYRIPPNRGPGAMPGAKELTLTVLLLFFCNIFASDILWKSFLKLHETSIFTQFTSETPKIFMFLPTKVCPKMFDSFVKFLVKIRKQISKKEYLILKKMIGNGASIGGGGGGYGIEATILNSPK
jgi:hypothetical protein